MSRTYCYSCGAEAETDPARLLPMCASCVSIARDGEARYAVVREGARAETQLTSDQVLEQLRTGILSAEDHVAGRGRTYLRVDQHPDFAPFFTPHDPRYASLRQQQKAEASVVATRRRRRVLDAALRVAGVVALIGGPVALWQAGILSMDNPTVAGVVGSVGSLFDDAVLTVRKAVDEDVAVEQLEQSRGLPGKEIIASLQQKWPDAPGGGADRMKLAWIGLFQGTREGVESARRELEWAVAVAPEDVEAVSVLAVVYAELGDEDPELRPQGVELFRRALVLDEDHPAVLRGHAGMALAGDAYGEAAEKARQCLVKIPDDPFCNWYLGAALVQLRQFSEATDALLRASAALGDAPAVDLELGRAAMESCRYAEAQATLEPYAKRYPDDPGIHLLLADFYRQLGQYDKAVSHGQLAAKLNPTSRRTRETAGVLLLYAAERPRAAADLLVPLSEEKGMERDERARILLHASRAALGAGQIPTAIRLGRTLTEARPGWPPGQLALAQALLASGDPAAAEESLKLADETAVDEALAARYHLEAGRFFTQQNRTRHASFELESARDMRPDWLTPRLELAQNYLELGNGRGALDIILESWWIDAAQDQGRDPVQLIPVEWPDIEALQNRLVKDIPAGSALGQDVPMAIAVLETIHCISGDTDCRRARQMLEAVRQERADDIRLIAWLARLELEEKDGDGAEDLLGLIRASEEETAHILALSGYAAALRGRAADMEKHFALAERIDPGTSTVARHHVYALFAIGRTEEAIALGREVAAADPGDVRIRRFLLEQESH
ncbi:MAG: tetratricopeptide repeat protein [Alphaproteobacteria bacterium]|nr:tetratricopeptide repeat protein [Alphaproteobacteria bacterium]